MNQQLVYILNLTLFFLCAWYSPCEASSISEAVDEGIREALLSFREWKEDHEARFIASPASIFARPFVTLTYAQSLDGKIARSSGDGPSSNFALSCDESLLLTHALRSTHEGILIGGTTLEVDNPRLTNRLWGKDQPRPIVLDTHLTHIQTLGATCHLQNPIICCSAEAASSLENLPFSAQILTCRRTQDGSLDIEDVLHQLRSRCGIRSLMVEGGASVLSCFLQQDHLVDALCVTVSPKLLGSSGFGPSFEGKPKDFTSSSQVLVLGEDAIIISCLRS